MTEDNRRQRRPRADRERIVLDTAARLFYARGVHEVGMDELVRASGLGKATVYRLFPTKDALVGAYLARLSARILALIDADAAGPPRTALHAVIDAVERDVGRPDFRGCPFNNASIEYADPAHPARAAVRDYRAALHDRLGALTARLCQDAAAAAALAGHLAVLIDGAYTNGAHLGPQGLPGCRRHRHSIHRNSRTAMVGQHRHTASMPSSRAKQRRRAGRTITNSSSTPATNLSWRSCGTTSSEFTLTSSSFAARSSDGWIATPRRPFVACP
jgi:AcrR family transcriptional regulator